MSGNSFDGQPDDIIERRMIVGHLDSRINTAVWEDLGVFKILKCFLTFQPPKYQLTTHSWPMACAHLCILMYLMSAITVAPTIAVRFWQQDDRFWLDFLLRLSYTLCVCSTVFLFVTGIACFVAGVTSNTMLSSELIPGLLVLFAIPMAVNFALISLLEMWRIRLCHWPLAIYAALFLKSCWGNAYALATRDARYLWCSLCVAFYVAMGHALDLILRFIKMLIS